MLYQNVTGDTFVPEGTPDGTLFVCVDSSWNIMPCVARPASLEDCARGYWTKANLDAAHAAECTWLMARWHGIIVGAWRIERPRGATAWLPSYEESKETWPEDRPMPPPLRLACRLRRDDSVERFIGQKVRLGRSPNSLRGYFAN